jgi:hypothetical protein
MYNLAMHLHQVIQSKVNAWRGTSYPSPDYPAVAKILEYATVSLDGGGVQGRYELPAPAGPTTVAVNIIDMLDEEVLTTATV